MQVLYILKDVQTLSLSCVISGSDIEHPIDCSYFIDNIMPLEKRLLPERAVSEGLISSTCASANSNCVSPAVSFVTVVSFRD